MTDLALPHVSEQALALRKPSRRQVERELRGLDSKGRPVDENLQPMDALWPLEPLAPLPPQPEPRARRLVFQWHPTVSVVRVS